MATLTIKQWLKNNNVPKSATDKGKYVVAISVDQSECDTVVNSTEDGLPLPMKRITDFEMEVDPDITRILLIKAEGWKRMTTKNLWLANLKKHGPKVIDKDQENLYDD